MLLNLESMEDLQHREALTYPTRALFAKDGISPQLQMHPEQQPGSSSLAGVELAGAGFATGVFAGGVFGGGVFAGGVLPGVGSGVGGTTLRSPTSSGICFFSKNLGDRL